MSKGNQESEIFDFFGGDVESYLSPVKVKKSTNL